MPEHCKRFADKLQAMQGRCLLGDIRHLQGYSQGGHRGRDRYPSSRPFHGSHSGPHIPPANVLQGSQCAESRALQRITRNPCQRGRPRKACDTPATRERGWPILCPPGKPPESGHRRLEGWSYPTTRGRLACARKAGIQTDPISTNGQQRRWSPPAIRPQ